MEDHDYCKFNKIEVDESHLFDQILGVDITNIETISLSAFNNDMSELSFDDTALHVIKDELDISDINQDVDSVDSYSQFSANHQTENPVNNHNDYSVVDNQDEEEDLNMLFLTEEDMNPRFEKAKPWPCATCSKSFQNLYTLNRHIRTHTDERNYKCDFCGKAFRQTTTLNQHLKIHSDDRPHVCMICSKSFNRLSTLLSHRKIHGDQKPHKCETCGKAFHQKGNLQNHLYTHTNERPYKCDICGKGFNQMSNLMCHRISTHSDAGSHFCSRCGASFPRRKKLRDHEKTVHGIPYSSAIEQKENSPPKRFSALFESSPTSPNYMVSQGSVLLKPTTKPRALTSRKQPKENFKLEFESLRDGFIPRSQTTSRYKCTRNGFHTKPMQHIREVALDNPVEVEFCDIESAIKPKEPEIISLDSSDDLIITYPY